MEGLKGAVAVAVGEKHSLALQAWNQGPLLDVTWAGEAAEAWPAFSPSGFPQEVSICICHNNIVIQQLEHLVSQYSARSVTTRRGTAQLGHALGILEGLGMGAGFEQC